MDLPSDRPITKSTFLAALPPEWPEDPSPQLSRQIRETGRRLVILDDDPTGGQTIHGLEVLTRWNPELLRQALSADSRTFFILTNSRSMPADEAAALDQEIAIQLAAASLETGVEFDLLVRGDSTLRGHYPTELDAIRPILETRLNWTFDGTILCPFFLEGGRLTAGDIHWVTEDDHLVPASQTEFARDATFEYRHANLREWVEEKTGGRVRSSEVITVSLETIRDEGPAGVYRTLMQVKGNRVVAVNAVTYRDMAVFVQGLLDAQESGRRFLFRTAASFVKIRSGTPERDLLTSAELSLPGETGGLVVVGSYVQKTTYQLHKALELPDLEGVEIDVPTVLDPERRDEEIARVAAATNRIMASGKEAILYTSRDLETQRGKAGDLDVGSQVSSALVQAVRRLATTPRFIIAKGGITASDLATEALAVQRALVIGQILPGVPVWRLQEESRFPGMPYVVFPGNVGTDDSVAEAVRNFR